VAAQLRIAAGERLPFAQSDLRPRGHAIEVRLYAEDPQQSFFPSAGMVHAVREPAGPGVRVDSALRAGVAVPVEYDPMLAKISAWGADRRQAIERLRGALAETVVLGPTTNLAFLRDVLAHPAFGAGATHTGFLNEHLPAWHPSPPPDVAAIVAALAATRPAARATDGGGPRTEPTPWETLGRWRLSGT
jgi:acetyl/propionyl-CoA carboxylase alpha subunit